MAAVVVIVPSGGASRAGTPTGYNVQVDGVTVTKTGTTSPTLLPLGVHTWTARAYNAVGYSAWASPAWTVRVTDTLPPPGTPLLLSPPDDTVTSTQAITFTWQAGAGAAPEGYNLDVDGSIITTAATLSPTTLSTGVHTWTVRAYNAGGTSAWAAPWSVKVEGGSVHLPVVLRNR